MTMRRFCITALFALLFCSCAKTTPPPDPPKDTLTIDLDKIEIPATGSSFDLTVKSNCDWTLKADAEWAYVHDLRSVYNGDAILHITVAANKTMDLRSAVFVFKYSQGEVEFRMDQLPFDPDLSLSENELSFGYRTAEKLIYISSNCGWVAASDANWLAIKPSTGLVGLFEMTINVETNNMNAPRTASVIIENKEYGLRKTVSVHQNGKPDIEDKDYIDEYGLNYGNGILVRGLFWAPVNCGYKEDVFPFGKMYQWGRKTGVGYHDAVFSDGEQTTVCELWKGENGNEAKGSYYKVGEESEYGYDWIKDGDNSFWNLGTEENPVKNQIFDPCPEGWRIPTSFEFKSLIEYTYREWKTVGGVTGYDFDGIFLPACGRLNALDGLSYDRNIEGYYWTVSAKEGDSSYLFFYNEDCSINIHGSRAGGCAVRCVRE